MMHVPQQKYEVQIFADYFQIWLEDRQASLMDHEFIFTDQHLSDRVWTDSTLLIMNTARNMTVPVEVQVSDTAPVLNLDDWDHVVETGRNFPSGQIEIFGCGGHPGVGFSVPPGRYHVRFCCGSLAELSEDGLDGADHYLICLWPGVSGETRVLRRFLP